MFDLRTLDPRLYAYDKASGRLLAEVALPANASGAPMTYMAGASSTWHFLWGAQTSPRS